MNTKLNVNAIEPGSIPLTVFDDDAIQNMPFEKGDAENSAVLKGETDVSGTTYKNRAISQTSMAVGAATTAGLKGWYYSNITFGSKPVITLSDKQPYALLGKLVGGEWKSGTPNIAVGDKVSIVNNAKYDYCGEVESISGNKVTLKSALPFDTLDIGTITVNNPDDWSIYLPEKESAGIIDFGGGALAEGVNTKSTNIASHAEGIQTHAYGQFSHAEGRETKAGYAAHAEGRATEAKGESSHTEGLRTKTVDTAGHAEGADTIAGQKAHAEGSACEAQGYASHAEGGTSKSIGQYSHAEGKETEASGNNSHAEGSGAKALDQSAHAEGVRTEAGYVAHAEGYETKSSGQYSHTEGYRTEANNNSEHACGKYNKSVKSSNAAQATVFSVGRGTSETDRKNIFEIKANGDVYIEGIAQALQDYLENLFTVTISDIIPIGTGIPITQLDAIGLTQEVFEKMGDLKVTLVRGRSGYRVAYAYDSAEGWTVVLVDSLGWLIKITQDGAESGTYDITRKNRI